MKDRMLDNAKIDIVNIIEEALKMYLANKKLDLSYFGAAFANSEPLVAEFKLSSRNIENKAELRLLLVVSELCDYSVLPLKDAKKAVSKFMHNCDNYRKAVFAAKEENSVGGKAGDDDENG